MLPVSSRAVRPTVPPHHPLCNNTFSLCHTVHVSGPYLWDIGSPNKHLGLFVFVSLRNKYTKILVVCKVLFMFKGPVVSKFMICTDLGPHQ